MVYLSYLYSNPGPVPAGHEFRVALMEGTSQRASFGKEINAQWRLSAGGTGVNVTSTYIANYAAVMKLEYAAGTNQTTVTGYLARDTDTDTDLRDLSVWQRTGTLAVAGKIAFDQVRIYSHNTSTAILDEIRISDDLAHITASPDPLLVANAAGPYTADNAPRTFSLPVSNAGATQNLVISSVTPGGADAAQFSVVTGLPLTLAPGESGLLDISFTPGAAWQASYSTTLSIASNQTGSPATLSLNVTNRPDPRISSASMVALKNNGVAAAYSLPYTNTGVSNGLSVSSVVAGGVDVAAVSAVSFTASLLPTEAGAVSFTFTPTRGSGEYAFTFDIASNDLSTPLKTVAVTMTVAEPLISVAGSSVDFGLLAATPAEQTLTVVVTNAGGTLPLTISETSSVSGHAAFTLVSPALPVTLSAGQSQEFVVKFAPGSASGRFTGELRLISNDANPTVPVLPLLAFVEPRGTVVARFDFDPSVLQNNLVDSDTSAQTSWRTADLIDSATGTGALSAGNQTPTNRAISAGTSGNFISFSSSRESDANLPEVPGGNQETTWTSFEVMPNAGTEIDYTGGTAVVDTYARNDQNSFTGADWTLYYSVNGGTWTSLGTQTGASQTPSGISTPLGLAWNLDVIGKQTLPVAFLLDPLATDTANGTVIQRAIGFDNLTVSAGTVTSSNGTFATWAAAEGITGGAQGDSDSDGIPNLVEYSLATNPHGPDGSAGALTGRTVTFNKRPLAVANGDVSWAIQTSPDLGITAAWTAAATPPDTDSSTQIIWTLPPGPGKLFARLIVTQLP